MKFPLAVLLLVVASCSKDDQPPPDITVTRTLIREVIEKYHSAGDAADVDTMKSLLTPDVSMFRGQEEFARGLDQCVDELTMRVAMFKGQARKTLLGSVTIDPMGDMAVATYVAGVGTLRAPITAVFRRTQGKWLIKHLHESWPQPHEKPAK
jgi:ketosteroid isomerase-like protein